MSFLKEFNMSFSYYCLNNFYFLKSYFNIILFQFFKLIKVKHKKKSGRNSSIYLTKQKKHNVTMV